MHLSVGFAALARFHEKRRGHGAVSLERPKKKGGAPTWPAPPRRSCERVMSFQKRNFKANWTCRELPKSPVGNRVLVITPNDVLPGWAILPGWPKFG